MSTKSQTGTLEVTDEEKQTEPEAQAATPGEATEAAPAAETPPEEAEAEAAPAEAAEQATEVEAAPAEQAPEVEAGSPEDGEVGPEPQAEASGDAVVEDPEESPAPEVPGAPTAADKLAAAAERMSEDEVRSTLESLLLVADKPLTPQRVQEATGLALGRIRAGFEVLGGTFRDGVSGMVLTEVAGGYQLRTCASNSAAVKRLLQVRPHRLTRAALETLSIVAYRQPVTRPEVEEIRGVDSGAVMRALLERELIQVLGKKEEPGRPLLYGTTRAFLEFFDLKDLASLPTLREFHSLDEEHERIVEERYPDPEEPNVIDVLSDEEPLEEHRSEDEEALEELDDALRDTRRRDKALRRVLTPNEPEPELEPGEEGSLEETTEATAGEGGGAEAGAGTGAEDAGGTPAEEASTSPDPPPQESA